MIPYVISYRFRSPGQRYTTLNNAHNHMSVAHFNASRAQVKKLQAKKQNISVKKDSDS
jgi:hypothetical protein